MISVKDLIKNIPEGKKIGYLNRTFYTALKKYYDNYRDSEDIDIDDLVSNNFRDLILKNNVINDLRLFEESKINSILKCKNSKEVNLNEIRSKIIKYYSFEYETDVIDENEYSVSSTCEVALHDFQERVRRKVINLIFQNQMRFLIHMPTGSGKTRTAGEIILDFIRLSASRALLNNKIKILWIAQSSELCYQAYETIKWLLDKKGTTDLTIGHYYEDNNLVEGIENESAIIFCSIQKLLIHYKEPIWQKIRNENYLVIVDEAHRSVASQWVKALNYFVSNNNTYLMGLTATPGLGKGDDSTYMLSSYYQSNKITITNSNYTEINNPIHYLVEREFLANIKRVDIDSYVDLDDSINMDQYQNFIFTKKTLKQLSINPERNSSIINIIRENHRADKKILVFTCGLDHNRVIQTLLSDLNIEAETVDANSKNRNTIIQRFKYGDLKVLLNFGVLTTGFDAPKTDICIIARPITSIVMYSQMVGRILRGPLNGGNIENTLYTIKDNLNHGDYDNMFNSFNEFYN